jgi:hypothetical protein
MFYLFDMLTAIQHYSTVNAELLPSKDVLFFTYDELEERSTDCLTALNNCSNWIETDITTAINLRQTVSLAPRVLNSTSNQ